MDKRLDIIGGPERKAFNRKNVIPMTFSEDDAFYDISARLNKIDKDVRKGRINNVIIICEHPDYGISTYWRGKGRMSKAIGILEFAKQKVYEYDTD